MEHMMPLVTRMERRLQTFSLMEGNLNWWSDWRC
jgi:hypothetical protein